MVRKTKASGIAAAFSTGHRDGLVALGAELGSRMDATDPGDSTVYLRLTRAFLAVCRQIESIDRAKAVAALNPKNRSAATTAGPVTLLDEMRARRESRRRTG